MTTTKTARYFGKCLACKKSFVRDFPTIGSNCIPVVISLAGYEDIFNASCLGILRCDCGGRVGKLQGLRAKFSAKHECNDKCVSSTSHKCECSCRGKNHGTAAAKAA